MENTVEKFVVYSYIENGFVQNYCFKYKGGCDFTNNIFKAHKVNSYDIALSDIRNYEVDMCEIIKINCLIDSDEEE